MSELRNQDNEIGALVRKLEQNFTSGTGALMSRYVTSDLYDDINKIYAYLESKHISGETDSMGREKPFFNIVLAARNIWFRATDIDRKNIKVKATKEADVLPSFLATVKLQDWMRKENFGAFLNDWGMELAGFNSAVVKFVEANGELHKMVVPWSRLIVDQIDFKNNPKIEILELTEAQLRQRKGYDKKMVNNLCQAVQVRQTTDKQNKDQKTGYIKLYEIHGNLPLSYLTGKEKDKDEFVQQMHVISFVEGKEKGAFDDFTLISGREERDPYMLTALLPATDGSVSLNGAVKNLFDAQWMANHTVKSIKDQLDLASKLIFQTSDGNFVGQNALSAIQNGDILIHQPNQPLTELNNTSHDITALQNFGTMWKAQSSEINGISEAMLGVNPPSGSAWRQTEALLSESHSLFEVMTENKGLYIEEMLRTYVIPFHKKQLANSDEIAAILDGYDINKIDTRYVRNTSIRITNQALADRILKGEEPTAIDQEQMMNMTAQELKQQLSELGNQRFFKPSDLSNKTWKDLFKNLEWEVEVEVTGEAHDTQNALTTLTTVLQTIGRNPAILQDQTMRVIFNRILETTGVLSPLELPAAPTPSPIQTQPLAVSPNGGQPVGGGGMGLPANQ